MRILLDECVPRPLLHELSGHDARTIQQMGWAGKRNGDLLAVMTPAGFEVLLTVDQNLSFQQNLASQNVSVIVIAAVSNRLDDLLPLMPQVHAALVRLQPGNLVVVTP